MGASLEIVGTSATGESVSGETLVGATLGASLASKEGELLEDSTGASLVVGAEVKLVLQNGQVPLFSSWNSIRPNWH